MVIPFSPSPFVANAKAFNPPITASPSNLCKPPQDGFKFLPMQFQFIDTFVWSVDLGVGAPNPPLSQLCAMYLDNSLSNHNAFVYFPDSGFLHVVNRGNAMYFPVLTGRQSPKFYVGLAPFFFEAPLPGDLKLPLQDIVNVICLNQFVPGFNNNITSLSLQVSAGDFFGGPVYNFIMDDIFETTSTITGGSGSINETLLNHNQWYMTALDISIIGNTTDGSTAPVSITLLDNGTPIMVKQFILGPDLREIQLFDKSGLNYKSLGGGTLVANINTGSAVINAALSSNIFGGVLVA